MNDTFRQAALAWAARGFRVFPLQPRTKIPYANSDWTRTASSDTATVQAVWSDPVTGAPLEHNIGVLCDDLIVIDVDTKKAGVEATAALLDLGVDLYTLTVSTPSGGQHVYYSGPAVANRVEKLGRGLDVRSFHGYVIAPGSFLDGAIPSNKGSHGWYALEIDAPVAEAPQHLIDKCGTPVQRAAGATQPVADLDRPETIAAAAQYLDREAPAAVEGDGGDATTFRVAAKLKDFGVSETTALMLMWERWNHRCSPPWDHGDLARKVANAFRYGAFPPGARAPQAEFGGVRPPSASIELGFDDEARSPFVESLRFRPYTPVEAIPPKPWVVHGLLCRGVVTVLAAEGGSGKTGLTVALAAHIAEGKSYSTWNTVEPTRVLVMNGEDSRDELQARMHGVCSVFGFEPEAMADKVQLVPAHDWRVADGRSGNVREQEMRLLADYCIQERIGVIVIDPLRLTHDSDENDNGGMAAVMRAFGALARRANAAILLIHHAGKARGKSAGDAGASRGASAVVDHARVAVTLVNAQDGDDERHGVPREEIELYARVDDAKQNLARKHSAPRWFKKVALPLPNGDETFVMRPADLKVDKTGAAKHIAETLYREMTRISTAAVTLYHAAQLLIDGDPLYANYPGDGKAKVQRVMAKIRPFLRDPGVQVWDGDRTALVVHVAEKSGSDVKHMVVIR
jgi:hypothetical protein